MQRSGRCDSFVGRHDRRVSSIGATSLEGAPCLREGRVHAYEMGDLKSDLSSEGVELRETHISQVFLGSSRVYKVKRPVALGFLDFSTLARRKSACDAEVLLNR